MELVLLRHGETQSNREKRYMGTINEPITPEAEEIAKQAAANLPRIDALFASPMIRCQQTAALLYPQEEIITVDGLREMDFGAFEGKTYEELKENPIYRAWLEDEGSMACPGGESRKNFTKRCGKTLEALIAFARTRQYQRIGIVAHGGILMALLSEYGNEKKPFFSWLRPNCSGYLLDVAEPDMILNVQAEIGSSVK